MMHDILIVDDEDDIRRTMSLVLEGEGYRVRGASDPEAADAAMAEQLPSLLILDIWFQGSRRDGVDLLQHYAAHFPFVPVLMMSGHGTIETAVRCTRIGAYDFIEKPMKKDKLLLAVRRALDDARLRRENEELRQAVRFRDDLVGSSPAAVQLRDAIERVARTESRVLITGPAGSGKELVARHIHHHSPRASGPFVTVNAATMEPDGVEEALFGSERNSGAGAPRITAGMFERAHRGTLLLDNVPDMPLETQAKILHALQHKVFQRKGGETSMRADVRVLASASSDIGRAIDNGRFREDLFYRLNVVSIRVPPLSERRGDIVPLSRHFIEGAVLRQGLGRRTLTRDAEATLLTAAWPGNVRQLRNVIESLLIMAPDNEDDTITAAMLPAEVNLTSSAGKFTEAGDDVMSLPLREAREAFERAYLDAQLARFGNNVTRVAREVGMERSALHRKLRSLDIGVAERDTGS